MDKPILKTTSGGGVILNPKGEVAVVNQQGISWSLPKGHIEADESPREAALREIKEETGITDLHFVKELGTYERFKIGKYPGEEMDERKELKTITLFLFTTTETALKPSDPENPSARWVPKEKVADLLTHPKDKEFFVSILPQLP